MDKYLSIISGGRELDLGEDFSIDMSFENPMFNDAQKYSYPVSVPIGGNRHLLKNMDDKRSSLRPVSIEDTRTRIVAEGIPFFTGKIKTSDSEELTDEISFSVDGESAFKTLIQNLECQDIPVKDQICIGEKLGEVKVDLEGSLWITINKTTDFEIGNLKDVPGISKQTGSVVFTPQALGFSVPYKCCANITDNPEPDTSKSIATGVDGYTHTIPKIDATNGKTYINVSAPYGSQDNAGRNATYCNARVAYKHYKMDEEGKTSDSVEVNPYMVLDADRPQSGICFYILYFLDCLFAHLGLDWDNSELMKIEDMKRLCFYTTKCSFDEVPACEPIETTDLTYANNWLSSHGCGAQLELSNDGDVELSAYTIPAGTYFTDPSGRRIRDGYVIQDTVFRKEQDIRVYCEIFTMDAERYDGDWEETYLTWKDVNIVGKLYRHKVTKVTTNLCNMYANSGNFPETTVTTIIESLENQFGIRFVYEEEKHKVTARLVRDMYRSGTAPRPFLGEVYTMHKVSEKVTGVKCMYSDESDGKEQRNNIKKQVKDYDLNYDYIDYPDPTKMKQKGMAAACTTELTKKYSDFVGTANNTDNTCYIDKQTGNAYRVKIDSEATDATNQNPRWFEAGALKGAEFGDCSDENEDFIVELSSSFQPIPLSDVNGEAVRMAALAGALDGNTDKNSQPLLVPFMDEDMEHEYIAQELHYPIDLGLSAIVVKATLHLRENYDVSDSDDGNSPLQSYDWGNAIMIMRGGGTDATLQSFDGNYDGFGNSKWRTTVGGYAMTNDSIDMLGNEYDYNTGDVAGIGTGERFSLKPRAFKVPEWLGQTYTAEDGTTKTWTLDDVCRADYHDSEGWHFIRTRGWADRFLYEHANFLINRRKFIVSCRCTAAFLLDIINHWMDKWNIDGEIGYINKINTSLSAKDGVTKTEIEFYAI